MRYSFHKLLGAFLVSTLAQLAPAGTMSLSWDPVVGAAGYRIYYGTTSRSYTQSVDVGGATQANLANLTDCTTYYASVKAYGGGGESPEFSNEVAGWARPVIDPHVRTAVQGSQVVVDIDGANFDSAATVILDTDSLPVDVNGNPLIVVQSYSVVACDRIQALVTVEPAARGFQAAPIGALPIGLALRNPDGVYNTGSMTLDILFDPSRADINRTQAWTQDRVDGADLATLARSWTTELGDDDFAFDCDLDGDTRVDGGDLALLASLFGRCRSGATWSGEACP